MLENRQREVDFTRLEPLTEEETGIGGDGEEQMLSQEEPTGEQT